MSGWSVGPQELCQKEDGKGYWIDVNLGVFLQEHDRRLRISSCSIQQCKQMDLEKCIDAYYSNSEIKNLERIICWIKKQESKITLEVQHV